MIWIRNFTGITSEITFSLKQRFRRKNSNNTDLGEVSCDADGNVTASCPVLLLLLVVPHLRLLLQESYV
jgi:hypothetical protein